MADWALALGGGAAVATVSLIFTVGRMAKQIDRLQREVQAVYAYAQEFDPRHDEERRMLDDLDSDRGVFAGTNHRDLVNRKRAKGERTLLDPILPPDA